MDERSTGEGGEESKTEEEGDISDGTGFPQRKEGVSDDGSRFSLPLTSDVMEVLSLSLSLSFFFFFLFLFLLSLTLTPHYQFNHSHIISRIDTSNMHNTQHEREGGGGGVDDVMLEGVFSFTCSLS